MGTDAPTVRPLCQSVTYNNKRRLLNNSLLVLFVPTSLLNILVLVEDALRASSRGQGPQKSIVLILVLMEDALRAPSVLW